MTGLWPLTITNHSEICFCSGDLTEEIWRWVFLGLEWGQSQVDDVWCHGRLPPLNARPCITRKSGYPSRNVCVCVCLWFIVPTSTMERRWKHRNYCRDNTGSVSAVKSGRGRQRETDILETLWRLGISRATRFTDLSITCLHITRHWMTGTKANCSQEWHAREV